MATFIEKEFGRIFNAIEITDEEAVENTGANLDIEWGMERGATHIINAGYHDERFAKVMRTIAYVGIDEDINGDILWQKWAIRHI